jgi:two-component system, chemotaxis family, protein-glutamate methylesterase/glutaminase
VTSPSRAKIRVLVVDDSAFVRQALSRMIASAPDMEVAGTATDGLDGVEKAKSLAPDVITLDIQMPRLGGLEALQRIMAESPVPVLLLSSLTQEGAEVTLRGLDLGAVDFVDKSRVQGSMNLLGLAEELQSKIRALAWSRERRASALASALPSAAAAAGAARGPMEAVVIGTSTGGPPALQVIIPSLPADLNLAILIVQHMPLGFTRSLAQRLASKSQLPVREAEDEELVKPRTVLIAPAGKHMRLRRRGSVIRVLLDDEPRDALHRPSVDVLMTSVAKAYGSRVLGLVLTGMGADGVEGLRAIRAAGGQTVAESEETCVIYGMPKAAVEAGVVDRVVPLTRMADEIRAAV